ncbi:hypothetical protein ACJW30_04G051000 [Castanea mollissima]
MVTLYSYFSIILGKIENATKFYKGFRSANQKQFEDRDRLLQKNKMQQKSQINLQNKKKKSHHKKISGFQFAPGSSSIVLITSADS